MVTPVKKVPIHLQSAQNRLIIKNGTVVNCDKEEQVDIYIEVSQEEYNIIQSNGDLVVLHRSVILCAG